MSLGHVIDAHVFAYWPFNEAAGPIAGGSDALDGSGNGRDLSPTSTGSGNFTRISPGLILDADGCAAWHGAELTPWWQRDTDDDLRDVLKGSWTLEFWVTLVQKGGYHNLFCHTHTSKSSHPGDDDLMLGVFRASDKRFIMSWTGGVTQDWHQNYTDGEAAPFGVRKHIGVIKTVELDGSVTLRYVIDGVLDSTYTGIDNVSQASDAGANGQFRIGCYATNADSPFAGVLDDVCLSDIARTVPEVLETYTRGITEGPVPDTTPPVVTLISPSGTNQIYPATPVVIDVTDESGLAFAALSVKFANGDYDVIWDGDVFATKYAASSRDAISGGYRYTLRRGTGWIPGPVFKVSPVDTGGNQSED